MTSESDEPTLSSQTVGQVLFLHTNYPAQFRLLVKAFRANRWSVWFASHTFRHAPLPGIEYLPLTQAPEKGSKLDQIQLRSQLAFRDLYAAKRKHSLKPDLIYVHTGWGLGSFLRDLFPQAKIIAYSEWWFNFQAEDFRFDPGNPEVKHSLENRLAMVLRNQGFSLEMLQADSIVAPTEWQCNQLPSAFRERCEVIFDGIDLDVFYPQEPNPAYDAPFSKIDPSQPLLTYATRGLEPYRGFPEFAFAACNLLKARPNWQVAIAGKDVPTYFRGSGPTKQGFGAQAMAIFEAEGVVDRVHLLGSLPLLTYRNLLLRSNLHCYFTRPYVLSWSLLESAMCGCQLLSSSTPPVQEFLSGDPGSTLVDHTASDLAEHLIQEADENLNLTSRLEQAKRRLDHRQSIIKRVKSTSCVNKHLKLASRLLG